MVEEVVDKLLMQYDELDAAEVQELRYATERHVYNFLTSELAQKALSSSESYCEYTISAKLGEDFVTSTIDRMFKDDVGEYEIIEYKTCPINNVEHAASLLTGELNKLASEYIAEMELYAVCLLKLFPAQQAITTTIFFTHSGFAYSSRYDAEQLVEIEQKLLKNIKQISSGKFEKVIDVSFCCVSDFLDFGSIKFVVLH